MAKKISDLAAAAALDGTELSETVQGGTNVKFPLGAVTPPGYIDGLKMQWVSATALTVTSGAAYIPSLGRVLRVSASIAKSGLALTASTWYHVYLWLNGTNADVKIVTTAPSAIYVGTARTMSGDPSCRYVGTILTDSGGNIYPFVMSDRDIYYNTSIGNAPFPVVSNGRAVAYTVVSCAGVAPVTAEIAHSFLYNDLATTQTALISNSAGPSNGYLAFVASGQGYSADLALDANQAFSYMYQAAPSGSTGFTARITGYRFAR